MPEALEWIQCKKCGRRHRWVAELAGKAIACRCGEKVPVPAGAGFTEPAARTGINEFSDTIVEAADSPSARAPYEALDNDLYAIESAVASAPTLEERRATTRFYIWTGAMLFGLSMLIHALITQWQVYIILAAVAVPITFWGFFRAKRRWQKGRSFSEALARSLGS